MEAHSILGELGYVIPTGIAGVLLAGFLVFIKQIGAKQDQDRAEHIRKWDSMIAAHKEAMTTLAASQRCNVESLIDSHQKQFNLLMDQQQREQDRQFKLYERNVSALEAMSHNLTIIVKESVK
jgi:hypothetical protein